MESVVCRVCGHDHDHSCGEGKVCGVCGHLDTAKPINPPQASEILPDFLYLGCFNYAMRGELLEAQGISRVLNTVAGHEYGLKKQFNSHSLPQGKLLPFDDAIQFLDQCEKDKVRVLVYCMTGKNRSPAIVIAYLMRCKRWRLGQSYEWVKERRPSVDLSPDVTRQLQEHEQKIFSSAESSVLPLEHVSGSKQVFNSVESSSLPWNPNYDAPLVVDFPECDDLDFDAFLLKFDEGFLPTPDRGISAETEEGGPNCLPRGEIYFGTLSSFLLKRKEAQGRAI